MRRIMLLITLLLAAVPAAQAEETGSAGPQAGTWKTWVIASGAQLRVPPPPDRAATEKELDELAKLAAARDRAALDRVAYWDTGAPSYRWSEIAVAERGQRRFDDCYRGALEPVLSGRARSRGWRGLGSAGLHLSGSCCVFPGEGRGSCPFALTAGVSYPSDVAAGLALGRKVAAL